MHKEALQWLADNRPAGPQVVLDLGSREAGAGRVRDLFTDSIYIGLDAQAGPGVDYIADITDVETWPRFDPFTLVICAEVFEHEPDWVAVTVNARNALEVGGRFLVTAAAQGRLPHTCRPLEYTPDGPPDQDGGYPPNPGEFYKSIFAPDLAECLLQFDFSRVMVEQNHDHHDVYAKAVK